MSDVFRANKPWSPLEDERLRALMAEGKTARAIAAYFKRTTRAVRRRADVAHEDLRVLGPRLPDRDLELAIQTVAGARQERQPATDRQTPL